MLKKITLIAMVALLCGCGREIEDVKNMKIEEGSSITIGRFFDTYKYAESLAWNVLDDKRFGKLVGVTVKYKIPAEYDNEISALYKKEINDFNIGLKNEMENNSEGSTLKRLDEAQSRYDMVIRQIDETEKKDNKTEQDVKNIGMMKSWIPMLKYILMVSKLMNTSVLKSDYVKVRWPGYIKKLEDTFIFIPPTEKTEGDFLSCKSSVEYSGGERVSFDQSMEVCHNKILKLYKQEEVMTFFAKQDIDDQILNKRPELLIKLADAEKGNR